MKIRIMYFVCKTSCWHFYLSKMPPIFIQYYNVGTRLTLLSQRPGNFVLSIWPHNNHLSEFVFRFLLFYILAVECIDYNAIDFLDPLSFLALPGQNYPFRTYVY